MNEETFYSALYLKNMIGLPVEICRERCPGHGGKYRLSDAKRVLREWRGEIRILRDKFVELQRQHKCVHRFEDGSYCMKDAYCVGWPYCFDHLPLAAKSSQGKVTMRAEFLKAGKCVHFKGDFLCGDPVVKGKKYCKFHMTRARRSNNGSSQSVND